MEKVYLNGEEYPIDKEKFTTLNQLLQHIQKQLEEKKETIIEVRVDELNHTLDFSDEDNDISLDYIDKIEILSENLDNLTIEILDHIEEYLKNIENSLNNLSENFLNQDKLLEAYSQLQDLIEGIKQINEAFTSMTNFNYIDLNKKLTTGMSTLEYLSNIASQFNKLSDAFNEKNIEEVSRIIKEDLKQRLKEFKEILPEIKEEIKNKINISNKGE